VNDSVSTETTNLQVARIIAQVSASSNRRNKSHKVTAAGSARSAIDWLDAWMDLIPREQCFGVGESVANFAGDRREHIDLALV
jgi:hypothetical protein